MIINSVKQGWYWEDTIIEDRPTYFVLNSPHWDGQFEDSIGIDEANLPGMLPAGGIFIDMSMWGIPAEYDIHNIEGNSVARGLESGIYEVSVRYYGQYNQQGPKVTPTTNSSSFNLFVPPLNDIPHPGGGTSEIAGVGPQCLKMNVYLRLYDENQEYSFHEKALGINIYLKQIETWEIDPNTSGANDEYRICQCSFEHGWKKIGDPTTGVETEFSPYSEVIFQQAEAPGIVSLNGEIGSTWNETSNASFTFLGRPSENFFITHGYTPTGTDLYRWKSSIVHNKKTWLGNTAKIQQLLTDQGIMSGEVGLIQHIAGDSVHISGHRTYDVFGDNSSVEVVNRDGDSIIALIAFADRLYICKENTIYILNTSQEYLYFEDSINISLINSSSVAKTPHGVCFLTKKGVYLHAGNSLIDLTEKRISMPEFWREDQYDLPFDSQILLPIVGYNAESDELFIYLSSTNNLMHNLEDAEDLILNNILLGNQNLGFDLTGDGIVDTADVAYMQNNWDSFNFIQDHAFDMYIYSFSNNTWTSNLTGSVSDIDVNRTNFIDYDSQLAFYNSGDGYVYIWNNSPTSSNNDRFKIQTKFMNFGFPSVEKKIRSITITYKGYKGTNANDGNNDIQVYVYANQDESTSITPIPKSGCRILNGECVLTNSTYDVSDAAEYTGQIARMKLDPDDDNMDSVSIVLAQAGDGSVNANFELYDITVVYNYMGVK